MRYVYIFKLYNYVPAGRPTNDNGKQTYARKYSITLQRTVN